MKAAQQKTGWNTNPFINRQIDQPIIYSKSEKVNSCFQLGIAQSSTKRNSVNTFHGAALKSINYQMYHPFFMEKAFVDMKLGQIPNFKQLYTSYLEIKTEEGKLLPAINFLPALRKFSLTKNEIASLLNNPEPNHVLAQNDEIKIILIRWQPGELSNIHGHAIGGCLIKVLHGEIEEKRYTIDSDQHLLSKSTYFTNHISYLDDIMGLHSVGNNQDSPAITLHIYTPGNYKAKQYEKASQ